MSLLEALLASVLYVAGIMAYIRYMNHRRPVQVMLTEIEQHLIDQGFLRE